MKRRTFLGTVAGGALAGLSGCIGGSVPTGYLHALLPKDRESESELRNRIASKGVSEDKIYINEFMNALQLRGDFNKLKDIADQLDLREYRVYSIKKMIPLASESQQATEQQGFEGFAGLGQLATESTSEDVSVGMIDTDASWNSWYTSGRLNRRNVAQNRNPILGPILRDEDHGEYTAKTLFHPQEKVTSDGPYVQGLATGSTPYHAQLSSITTISQFFRSLCESLEWMAKNEVDVIAVPLAIGSEDSLIILRLLEEFVTDLSDCIVVVSAGNVSVCNGQRNALSDTDVKGIVSAGAFEGLEDNLDFSGNHHSSDIYGHSGFNVGGSSYSGTSASSTVVSGILSLYIGSLQKEYPNLSRSEYRECALEGLLQSGLEKTIQCEDEEVIDVVRPMAGLEEAKEMARTME